MTPGLAAPPLVVHVIHHLTMGGMENTLVNLINRTPAGRLRHAVLCAENHTDFRDRIVQPDVPVVALHRSRIGVPAMRREIGRLLRQWRPAIVHTRNLSGLDALWPAWRAGVPVRVHSEHGWDVDDLKGLRWRPRLLRRLHAPLVTAYATVSHDLARYLRERVGIADSRIRTIHNGVDTERFRPSTPGDASPLPPGFGGSGRLCIGAVGRIQPVKDQATLVRAVVRLVDADPAMRQRLRLVIAGSGPLLELLRAQVTAAGIDDLAWLPGARDDVPDLMRAFDVFVLPSLNEGISNTILEALSSGLPVLASRVGGNPELVDDGLTGDLFTAGDDAALAALLKSHLDDPAKTLRQSAAARAAALERFGLEAMVQRYLGWYTTLLGR